MLTYILQFVNNMQASNLSITIRNTIFKSLSYWALTLILSIVKPKLGSLLASLPEPEETFSTNCTQCLYPFFGVTEVVHNFSYVRLGNFSANHTHLMPPLGYVMKTCTTNYLTTIKRNGLFIVHKYMLPSFAFVSMYQMLNTPSHAIANKAIRKAIGLALIPVSQLLLWHTESFLFSPKPPTSKFPGPDSVVLVGCKLTLNNNWVCNILSALVKDMREETLSPSTITRSIIKSVHHIMQNTVVAAIGDPIGYYLFSWVRPVLYDLLLPEKNTSTYTPPSQQQESYITTCTHILLVGNHSSIAYCSSPDIA